MLADLVVDLLVPRVGFRPETGRLQLRYNVVHVVVGIRHDGGHHDLTRRKPEGHLPGVVFDQDADEPLETAQDRAVEHHRTMLRPVLAHIFGAKPDWQVEVHLEGAALPFATDRVGQLEVELRAVEGALAGVDFIIVRYLADSVFKGGLRLVPDFVRADADFGPRRELHVELCEAEVAIDRRQKPDETGAFRSRSDPRCRRYAHHPV